jgi:hypothetical protein
MVHGNEGMTSHELDSTLSWERFVESCAEACQGGISEHEFGAALMGQRVRWEGVVERIDLKEKYVPGLRIKMPCVELPLSGGRTFVGRRLFLISGPRMISAVRENENVMFSGRFQQQDVAANVAFTRDDELSKVFLSLALEDGEVLTK